MKTEDKVVFSFLGQLIRNEPAACTFVERDPPFVLHRLRQPVVAKVFRRHSVVMESDFPLDYRGL